MESWQDISGSSVKLDSVIARYALAHWACTGATLFSLLSPSDWVGLDWSTLTLASRLWHKRCPVRLVGRRLRHQAEAAQDVLAAKSECSIKHKNGHTAERIQPSSQGRRLPSLPRFTVANPPLRPAP